MRYSDDRKSLAQELRDVLRTRKASWIPETDGPDLINAFAMELDRLNNEIEKLKGDDEMKAPQTFEIVECAESKIERQEEVLREVRHYLIEMSDAGIIAYPRHLMKRIDWVLT